MTMKKIADRVGVGMANWRRLRYWFRDYFPDCWRRLRYWFRPCECCRRRSTYLVHYELRNDTDGPGFVFYTKKDEISRKVLLCEIHKNDLLGGVYQWPTLMGFWVRKKPHKLLSFIFRG